MKLRFFLFSALSITLYGLFIEPFWLDVTFHKLNAKVDSKIRIAHISDLHAREFGKLERKVIDEVNAAKPDIVIISGDSVSDNQSYAVVREILAKISVPLGVYLVRGNWEHWHPSSDELTSYKSANVHFLNNESRKIRNDIWLIGIDDAFAGHPDIENATKSLPSDVFRVATFHSPEFFERTFMNYDLALAGHTHGGQLRVPFLGPIILPPHSGNYDAGWYRKEGSTLFVSRGLGTSIIPIRLNCRPELAIIDVMPTADSKQKSP